MTKYYNHEYFGIYSNNPEGFKNCTAIQKSMIFKNTIKKFKNKENQPLNILPIVPGDIALESLMQYTVNQPFWYAHNGYNFDYPIVEKEYYNYLGKNKKVDINQYKGRKRWKTIGFQWSIVGT